MLSYCFVIASQIEEDNCYRLPPMNATTRNEDDFSFANESVPVRPSTACDAIPLHVTLDVFYAQTSSDPDIFEVVGAMH